MERGGVSPQAPIDGWNIVKFKLPILLRLRDGRVAGLGLVAAGVGPLALYVVTLPRTVVLEDDGLFLMAGASLGVAHPPGYPLYTLICYLFMQLPFGTPAFLGHLSSAVLGALACGAVYVCARLLGAARVPALAAAWLFGASEHFWAQAIIAEVYTLNAFLFFSVYGLLLYGVRQSGPSLQQGNSPLHKHARRERTQGSASLERWVWLTAAVAYGFSLANHWPLMALATPGLVVVAMPAWRVLRAKLWLYGSVALLSVTLPYAWMVWRSRQNPLINFYGPIESVRDIWFYLSRQGYSNVDVSPSAGWGDRWAFLQWLGNEVVWQLTLPGFMLAVVGVLVLLYRRQLAIAGSGLLVFVGNSAVLIVLLSFDFDFLHVAIFRPYSLVCYGLVALWLSVGFQFLLDRFPLSPEGFESVRASGLKIAVAVLLAGWMVVHSVQADWQSNDRSDSSHAERYAETVFDSLPQDAMLFTLGDPEVGPLGYYRFVEERRPDVVLLNQQGLVFANRLYDWGMPEERRREALRTFVSETARPVFFTSDITTSLLGFGIRHHGFVKEIIREKTAVELSIQPHAERYFEELLSFQSHDRWERFRRNKLVFSFGQYLGFVILSGHPDLLERMQRSLALAERDFFSLMGMAELLLKHGDASHFQQAEEWLQKADPLRNETLDKERLARFLYLKGFLRYRLGDPKAARSLFEESLAIYPHPENASIEALKAVGTP